MKIKRLYIKDFGLLRNQTLEQIAPGLVVIGGPNRAGKTTLLNIFRYLPYGFPQQGSLPPAERKYEVEAELELKSSGYAKIYIAGFAEPTVLAKNGGDIDRKARDLYNGLDQFTYEQLFTLTLNELKKNPVGVSGKNYDRLQTILLGAGLTDIILLPQLEQYFTKEAEKIGGKHGNPSVGQFKPYYQSIEKGQQLRDEAAKQVDLYYHNSQQLNKITLQIQGLEEKKEKTRHKIVLLDLLKSNYENYSETKEIEAQLSSEQNKKILADYSSEGYKKALELKESYRELLKTFEEKNNYIKDLIAKENADDIIQKIIAKRKLLLAFQQELSGLKVGIKNCSSDLLELSELNNQLQAEINRNNPNWQDNYQQILQLNTDHVSQYKLNQTIDQYLELKNQMAAIKQEISKLNERKRLFDEQINQLQGENPASHLTKFYFYSLILILIGISTVLINPALAFIGFAGIIALGLYFFYRNGLKSNQRGLLNSKQNEQKELQLRLAELQFQLKQTSAQFIGLEKKIKEFKALLELDPATPTEVVKDLFREIKYLKKELTNLKRREGIILSEKNRLEHELIKIQELLLDFNQELFDLPNEASEKILENHQQLLSKLERLFQYLDYALEYDNYRIAKEELESKIIALISQELAGGNDFIFRLDAYITNGEKAEELLQLRERQNVLLLQVLQTLKTDRFSSALNYLYPKNTGVDNLLPGFEKLNEGYSSLEQIKDDYQQQQELLDDISGQLAAQKSIREELTLKGKELMTTEKIEESQRLIDQGRSGLQPLAEKYASYQVAAFILKNAKNILLEKTPDPLRSASDYFQKMTSEDYSAILAPEDLTVPNYRTVGKDGTIREDSDMLSRATSEQLFLAVRFSRIREITPPLPVIIDDTFVNFDDYHLSHTVDLINDLARTHQVFLLTCHPHLIKKIGESKKQAQYWLLNAGNFKQVNFDNLISFLTHPMGQD